MFHIHWRKIILVLVIVMIGHANLNAQKVFNLPNYDNKILHFGFYLALNGNAFGLTQSNYFVARQDTIKSISAPWNGGAMLGFIVSTRLNDYLDLRVLPGVSFTERELDYKFKNGSSVAQKFNVTYVDIPVMMKYKSKRRGNMRMYMIGGGKFTFVASAKTKDGDPDQMKLNKIAYGVEYGFGIDIYNEMFKFSPEIRFSHGFNNMATIGPLMYSKSVQSLSLHTITLYFNFE